MLRDVLIASCSDAGVKGWLYFSELLDLKMSFCFSALFLKVRKCGVELLMEEFVEKGSANVSMSFLLVASVLFFGRCLRAIGWLFPRCFPHYCPGSICSGRGNKLVDIILPTFLLGFLYSFSCFCPEKFENMEITLVYKNKFLVWGKNGDRCFLLIWVCWIQIYK